MTLSWPAPSLPGVCARTGLATRSGIVLTPRGATYSGAEVIVPFSQAATLRRRALGRVAVICGAAAIGCAVAIVATWFFAIPAVVLAAIAVYAGRTAHSFGVYPVLTGRELLLPNVHPAFAAAVAAMPERCGESDKGGCATCTSGCLPQVQTA